MLKDVLRKFWKYCPGFEMPAAWARVEPIADARQMRRDPQRLLRVLLGRFALEDLLASRLVTRGPGGELAISPKLSRPGTPLLGLRDLVNGELFDVLTPDGLVCSGDYSVFAAMRDQHTISSLDNLLARWNEFSSDYRFQRHVMLASTLPDVIILRSLGVPAALLDGFNPLRESTVDRLCRVYGLERDEQGRNKAVLDELFQEALDSVAEAVPAGNALPYPTLVAWSPATLSHAEPPAYLTALTEFERVTDKKNLDIIRVYDWGPAPGTIETLRKFVESGSVEQLREAMIESIIEECGELLGVIGKKKVIPPPPVTTLEDAIQRLRQAFTIFTSEAKMRRDRKFAIEEYRRFANNYLQTVSVAAAAAEDLAEQITLDVLNNKLRRRFEIIEQNVIYAAAVQREEAIELDAELQRLDAELQRCDTEILKITREMRTWGRRPLFRSIH